MVHIFGVNLPENKKVVYALSNIYGINTKSAQDICHKLGITQNCKVKDLKEQYIAKIAKILSKNYVFESNLKKEINTNIKRHMKLRNYKGTRFFYGLPVRGQRTKTNALTQRKFKNKYNINK